MARLHIDVMRRVWEAVRRARVHRRQIRKWCRLTRSPCRHFLFRYIVLTPLMGLVAILTNALPYLLAASKHLYLVLFVMLLLRALLPRMANGLTLIIFQKHRFILKTLMYKSCSHLLLNHGGPSRSDTRHGNQLLSWNKLYKLWTRYWWTENRIYSWDIYIWYWKVYLL